MQIIKPGTRIDFVKRMRLAAAASLILLAATAVGWITIGPDMGIDFMGGTEVEITFNEPVSIQKVRSSLNPMNLGDVEIKRMGGEGGVSDTYLIRVEKKQLGQAREQEGEAGDISSRIIETLEEKVGSYNEDMLRISVVGPRAGAELRRKAFVAVFVALVLMLIYIAVRFEVLFAFGAVLALTHDVLITVGFLIFTGKEFNLSIIAALLTIVGYSLNDTIVVYDRIRENIRKYRNEPITNLINASVSETLSRTLLTSSTTLLAVLVLLGVTRGAIQEFAFALTVGILVGTYSSIFVAGAFIVLWRLRVAPALGLDKKKRRK